MENASSSNSQAPSPVGSNDDSDDILPEESNTQVSAQSSENTEQLQEPEARISAPNNCIETRLLNPSHQSCSFSRQSELEAAEIDKLFQILTESESASYRGFLTFDTYTRDSVRRFSPYPVHQQLFLQQQQEQERRRQNLLSYRSSFAGNYNNVYRCCHPRFVFSDSCRSNSVRKVISFIDTLTDRKTAVQKDCDEKCVICMSNYVIEEELRLLKCSHMFHRKCIDEWLVKSYLCPVCRTNLTGVEKSSQLLEEHGSSSTSDSDSDLLLNYDHLFVGNRSSVPPEHGETKD